VRLFKEAGAEGDSRGFGFPTISEPLNEDPEAADIIEAAAAGKVQAMVRFAGNPALYCCDYDSRTALHLAASEGHLDIVKFLLGRMEEEVKEEDQLERVKTKLGIVNYEDRFYNTPAMDAEREGRPECYEELTRWTDELRAELKALGGVPVDSSEEKSQTPAEEDAVAPGRPPEAWMEAAASIVEGPLVEAAPIAEEVAVTKEAWGEMPAEDARKESMQEGGVPNEKDFWTAMTTGAQKEMFLKKMQIGIGG